MSDKVKLTDVTEEYSKRIKSEDAKIAVECLYFTTDILVSEGKITPVTGRLIKRQLDVLARLVI